MNLNFKNLHLDYQRYLANRIVAKLIDLLVIFLLAAFLPYPLGPLIGFAYSLLADGISWWLPKGQSFGKRLMNLQVINRRTHEPAHFKDSVLRNGPVGVAAFFAIIPVWGWLILILVGLPLMVIEIYLMVRTDSGQRWGDIMANTEVIELR